MEAFKDELPGDRSAGDVQNGHITGYQTTHGTNQHHR